MAQNPSLFPQITERYFSKFVGKVTETINGKPKEEQPLFKQFLTEEYSVDCNWGTTNFNQSIVSADIVSLESSVPLKSRGAIASAQGSIPKLAIGYEKGEKILQDINVMIATGRLSSDVATKVLDDVPRVIKGIDTALEIQFLQGLSTGVALIPVDEKNGVRADFGYKADNMLTVGTKWETVGTAKPLDDIQRMLDKADADGVSIELITISKKYLNFLRATAQGKQLSAQYKGAVITSKADLPTPTRSLMLEALKDEFNVDFMVIDTTLRVEKNDGTVVSVSAYEEDRVIALPSKNVGRLVYGQLVEKTMPVSGVSYADAGSYTLVSKFSDNNPLVEFTTGQALALPVIDNGSSIYMLKASQAG